MIRLALVVILFHFPLVFLAYLLNGLEGLRLGMAIGLISFTGLYFWGENIVLLLFQGRFLRSDPNENFTQFINNLAHKLGIKPPRLYLYRSPLPNALVAGPNVLLVEEGLSEILREEEMRAILAYMMARVSLGGVRSQTLVVFLNYLFSRVIFWAIRLPTRRKSKLTDGQKFLALFFIKPVTAFFNWLVWNENLISKSDEISILLCGKNKKWLDSALRKLNSVDTDKNDLLYQLSSPLYFVDNTTDRQVFDFYTGGINFDKRVNALNNVWEQ